ncbi:hypothetical protein [Parabacteroides faecis]|uniref:Uncharacterized protein n=1 Tax=Parabacteroides faecis TaxID=1217282 RepID=A0ABR6KKJ4_9BACT|nr:hypothetical protein [Parabacteroides faecis]MBB4621329.1 hypothetical protein [Parabacteroides faecis]GGJ84520.1 hypothetical protein GCM10007084_05290 [Parabacteroides faecis]
MKKLNEYPIQDETSSVKEPEITYQRSNSSETYPIMPLEEALKTGMYLEESRRLILERIHKDFHR